MKLKTNLTAAYAHERTSELQNKRTKRFNRFIARRIKVAIKEGRYQTRFDIMDLSYEGALELSRCWEKRGFSVYFEPDSFPLNRMTISWRKPNAE